MTSNVLYDCLESTLPAVLNSPAHLSSEWEKRGTLRSFAAKFRCVWGVILVWMYTVRQFVFCWTVKAEKEVIPACGCTGSTTKCSTWQTYGAKLCKDLIFIRLTNQLPKKFRRVPGDWNVSSFFWTPCGHFKATGNKQIFLEEFRVAGGCNWSSYERIRLWYSWSILTQLHSVQITVNSPVV